MSNSITVDNLDVELMKRLRMEAKKRGMDLSTLVKELLNDSFGPLPRTTDISPHHGFDDWPARGPMTRRTLSWRRLRTSAGSTIRRGVERLWGNSLPCQVYRNEKIHEPMPKGPVTCNADREFALRYHGRFVVGVFATYSLGLCIWGMAVLFGAAPGYTFSSIAARVGYSCLFEVLAVLFGFMAIRFTPRGVQRRERLVFTDTDIVLSEGMSSGSKKTKSVRYADVKEARYTKFGNMRMITVSYAGERFCISPDSLPREEDLDDLLDELRSRLEPFDVEVETREYLWYRPQFSLRFMLVVTALVAAGLGLRRYMDPDFHLSDLVMVVGGALWILTSIWLIFFANSPARIFTVGFVLGMLLEPPLAILSLSGTNPLGPCSSTMICQQMFTTPGSPPEFDLFGWFLLGGVTISGTIVGTASLLAWQVVKLAMRGRRGRDTSGNS